MTISTVYRKIQIKINTLGLFACWNRLFAVSILAFPGLIVWQRALSSFSREMKDTGNKHDYIKRLWMWNSLHDGMRERNGDKDRVRDKGKLYTACPLMWKKPARYRPKTPEMCHQWGCLQDGLLSSCIILPLEMHQYQNSSYNYINAMVSNG